MGIGHPSFSKADLSEIRQTIDLTGMRQILGRWGYKRRAKVRTPMDVFAAMWRGLACILSDDAIIYGNHIWSYIELISYLVGSRISERR